MMFIKSFFFSRETNRNNYKELQFRMGFTVDEEPLLLNYFRGGKMNCELEFELELV